mmetsp:Transcript_34686/g.90525  ORF Transcript_34686/g.90525 Transcript_34686/m.90525 type:complete len:201 (-) Transcript_34686:341-943(-)
MAAAVAAAARRRGQMPVRPQYTSVSPARQQAHLKALVVSIALKRAFRKYDTNNSGKLEREQLIKLLTDLDISTPEGQEPSEEEVNHVLKEADVAGDGCIGLEELQTAVVSWETFVNKRQEMEALVEKYDKSGTGKLERDELKAMLTDLNAGKPVSEQEVDWVLNECDVMGDGAISKLELVKATAIWYSHVQEKSKACTIL